MKYYVADFETVVSEDPDTQEATEVWAFGISQMYDNTDNVYIDNNIEKFFKFISKNKEHKIVYFHNLKFDGSFILDYLCRYCGYTSALIDLTPEEIDPERKLYKFNDDKDMQEKTFKYVITDLGIWYSITIKMHGAIIEFRDSLKLLPFSVKELGPAFDTKYRKLEMDYTAHTAKDEIITEDEAHYIANDILVVKEAMEKFLDTMNYRKNPPLTIGQACLREFKKQFKKEEWDLYFPNLAEIKLDPSYGSEDADSYIRRSYMGGWCYVDEVHSGLLNGPTKVCDVNSLYPFSMHSKSGNRYPIGTPTFFKGPMGLKGLRKDQYYFVRFKARFKLKKNYLPFLQLKYNENYRSNENLTTSARDRFGNIDNNLTPEFTLSKTMFLMFIQCYDISYLEILDGCIFETEIGLFDSYINFYISMKQRGARNGNMVIKTIGKLFANNLYGKMGTNPENSFKVIEKDSDEDILYQSKHGENKKPVAVQIASACTSYARRYTVLAALNNVECYRYSDTDSCHFVKPQSMTAAEWEKWQPKEMKIDDNELGAWKIESESKHSLFLRQKTYIEFDDDKYIIKCGGLPERSKDLLEASFLGIDPDANGVLEINKHRYVLDKAEFEFCTKKRTYKDFRQGLRIPGKLLPKIIKGGTVLINDCFTIK